MSTLSIDKLPQSDGCRTFHWYKVKDLGLRIIFEEVEKFRVCKITRKKREAVNIDFLHHLYVTKYVESGRNVCVRKQNQILHPKQNKILHLKENQIFPPNPNQILHLKENQIFPLIQIKFCTPSKIKSCILNETKFCTKKEINFFNSKQNQILYPKRKKVLHHKNQILYPKQNQIFHS